MNHQNNNSKDEHLLGQANRRVDDINAQMQSNVQQMAKQGGNLDQLKDIEMKADAVAFRANNTNNNARALD